MTNSDVALLGTVALILSVIAILLQVFNIGCAAPVSLFSVDTGPSPELEDTGTGPSPELEDTGTGLSPELEDTDSCGEKSAYFLACGQCFDCAKCWDGLGRCAAIGNTGEIEGCDLKVFCPIDRAQLLEGCACVMCCDV